MRTTIYQPLEGTDQRTFTIVKFVKNPPSENISQTLIRKYPSRNISISRRPGRFNLYSKGDHTHGGLPPLGYVEE